MKKICKLLGLLLILTSCSGNSLSSNSFISSQSNSISSIESSTSSVESSESIESSSSSMISLSSVNSLVSSLEESTSIISSSSCASSSILSEETLSVSSSISSISSSANKALIDISEWKNYSFSNGSRGCHNENWTYYYNTSINPGGVERGDKYGIDLCEAKQRIESPLFSSWKKVEVRIKLRFVPRSSDRYKTVKNTPQLVISCYDEHRTKLGTEDIFIEKNRIPTNDEDFYTLKFYLYFNEMNQFDIEYSNSVEHSGSWYTYAINEISLKGWPYGRD